MSGKPLRINAISHPKGVLQKLNAMRKEQTDCDLVITVEGKEIYANKNVLRAGSEYFDAMFTDDTKGKHDGVISMEGVTYAAVQKCIDFIYSGKTCVLEDECEDVLYCAYRMQLSKICVKISRFLGRRLTTKSFFKIRRIAQKFSLKKLNALCDKFAVDELSSLGTQEEFNSLDVDYVLYLLFSEKPSENAKLSVALWWLNDDLENREKYLMMFIEILDTSKLGADYSRALLESEPLCKKYPEFMEKLQIGTTYHQAVVELPTQAIMPSQPAIPSPSTNKSISVSSHAVSDSSRPVNAAKIPENLINPLSMSANAAMSDANAAATSDTSTANSQKSLYIFDEITGYLELYQPSLNRLTKVKGYHREMRRRNTFATCLVKEFLYIIGCHKTVFCLNLSRKKPIYRQIPSLQYDHGEGIQCVVHENVIYVGGNNKLERFGKEGTEEWEIVDLNGRKCHHSALASYNRRVFVIGGQSKTGPISSVSSFSPTISRWISAPSMNNPKEDASATTFNDKLYVAGGLSQEFEMYDYDSHEWIILPKMISFRSLFHLCVIDNHIFAVGNGSGDCSIEFYDVRMKKWSQYHDCRKLDIWALATLAAYVPEPNNED